MINYQTNNSFIYDVAKVVELFAKQFKYEIVPARMTEEMDVNVATLEEAIESFTSSCEADEKATPLEVLSLDDYAQGIKNFLLSTNYDNKPCIIVGSISKEIEISHIEMEVISSDVAAAKEVTRLLFKPVSLEAAEKETIDVKFWSWNGRAAKSMSRELEANYIDEVIANYNKKTAGEILSLRDNFADRNGKLLIFSGDPGTGKTTIIRSFAKDWKDYAALDYIIDPETFFNGPPSYMIDVIMSGKQNLDPEDWEYDFYSTDELSRKNKKKILILEDCGELIKSDAKTDVGSGLARFLNIVDGMIGSGLDLTVLLTTNEKIENFHPAVTREGRINTMIDFEKLDEKETINWLKKQDVSVTDGQLDKIRKEKGWTLAECYDALNKQENQSVKILSSNDKKQAVGFS